MRRPHPAAATHDTTHTQVRTAEIFDGDSFGNRPRRRQRAVTHSGRKAITSCCASVRGVSFLQHPGSLHRWRIAQGTMELLSEIDRADATRYEGIPVFLVAEMASSDSILPGTHPIHADSFFLLGGRPTLATDIARCDAGPRGVYVIGVFTRCARGKARIRVPRFPLLIPGPIS